MKEECSGVNMCFDNIETLKNHLEDFNQPAQQEVLNVRESCVFLSCLMHAQFL